MRLLAGQPCDEIDLRALTLCWCDVYLRRFPVPERARKALFRYANGSGIEAEELEAQLDEYCTLQEPVPGVTGSRRHGLGGAGSGDFCGVAAQ